MADENGNAPDDSNKSNTLKPTKDEDYGFDLYPERNNPTKHSVYNDMRHPVQKQCELNVAICMSTHPGLLLMSRAMRQHGCDINLRRHISCEKCGDGVNGGYDPVKKQVVVCHNSVKSARGVTCGVLLHEFMHAFDHCRTKMDFGNIKHLACTEIRAATISHCSMMAAFVNGDASPIDMKRRQRDCVFNAALKNVMMIRNISEPEGREIVNSVFDKCYNDLEPFGRRLTNKNRDYLNALREGKNYDYAKCHTKGNENL